MSLSEHLTNYSALLQIRKRAGRRDVMISGGLFLVTVLAIFALGLLGGLSGRSVYLVSAVEIALGIGFLTAWVRLEINKSLIEFADHLQRAADTQRGEFD
jgi:4-hydroxybenzoate polyprenyltransferase